MYWLVFYEILIVIESYIFFLFLKIYICTLLLNIKYDYIIKSWGEFGYDDEISFRTNKIKRKKFQDSLFDNDVYMYLLMDFLIVNLHTHTHVSLSISLSVYIRIFFQMTNKKNTFLFFFLVNFHIRYKVVLNYFMIQFHVVNYYFLLI